MKKLIYKNAFFTSILSVISLMLTLIFYSFIPNLIKINWYRNDEYLTVSKFPIIFLLPLISFIYGLIIELMPLGKRMRDFRKTIDVYHMFNAFIILMLVFMQLLIILNALGIYIPVRSTLILLLGFSVSLVGNYMPRLKSNKFFGIINKYTLSNPRVWDLTHRKCGLIWFILGILMMVCVFLSKRYDLYLIAVLFLSGIWFQKYYSRWCYLSVMTGK